MKKAMTSFVAIALGALAYSFSDRRKKRRIDTFMKSMSSIRFDRMLNRGRKRLFS